MAVMVLALVIVAISTLTAYWAGGRGPTVRGAQAEILVQVTGDSDVGRRLSDQLALLESGRVLDPAANELDLSTGELRRHLDAAVVDGSRVIRIEAWERTEARATEIVDVVARSYVGHLPTARATVVLAPVALRSPLAPTPLRSAALGAVLGLALATAMVVWSLRHRTFRRR